MDQRTTIKRPVEAQGVGLHSGALVHFVLRPAPPGHGLVFRRVDLGVDIPAHVDYLARLDHATTLSRSGASVSTVEHLLSALAGVGVDDVSVELDGPEVPIFDGSSAPFVDLLIAAGIRSQGVPRSYLKVLEPVEVRRGDKWLRLEPAHERRFEYTIAFDHPQLRHQANAYVLDPESFVIEIAPARTFGFLSEVERLRESGLARGGSLDNAIVFGPDGPLQPLRFDDECVRHKILDAIGDLAMAGMPIVGALKAHRAGHALHAAVVQELLARPQAYSVVTAARRRQARPTELAVS